MGIAQVSDSIGVNTVPCFTRSHASSDAVLDCRPQYFDETFEQSIVELIDQKNKALEAMASQVKSVLGECSNNSGLMQALTAQILEVIYQRVEQLVKLFDNSVLSFSDIYSPWRADLLRSAQCSIRINARKCSEETSTIGLCVGAIVGAGAAGVGGAFLGAMVGDVVGGVLGEPLEKLRKKATKRLNKQTSQLDRKISVFISSQSTDIKKLLVYKSGLAWSPQRAVAS